MAIYKYLREFWQSNQKTDVMRQRMIDWRREPATLRIEHPTRLDRARSVGYKAKEGYVLVRQRVLRGGRQRESIRKGRRSKHMRHRKILKINYQAVAEGRAAAKYSNLTVLNSYFVAKDGKHAWYEVVMVDKTHPNIKNNPSILGVANKKGRNERGLTSSGRRSRGLLKKGKGREKNGPSLNARKGQGN